MANPSPACTANGSATPIDATASSTVTIALANTSGANFWGITAVNADDLTSVASINATLVVNQVAKTATFTSPSSSGSCVIFQSTVGVSLASTQGFGKDANGIVQSSFSTTFKVNVKTANGLRVVGTNETTEQAAAGWIAEINAAIRALTSSGLSVTGTGIVVAVAGAISGTASLGASDTLLGTNHAANNFEWVVPGGDVTYASHNFTVTGFQGRPIVATAPTNGQVYSWSSGGSQWVLSTPGGAGAITSFGADLVNSTATNQYVSGISVNATAAGHGAGAAVNVNGTGTTLNWVDDVVKLQHTATTLLQLGAAVGDFISFGAGTVAASGFVRAPNATTIVAARASGAADITLVSTDASNNAIFGGANAASVTTKVGSTIVGQLAIGASDFTAYGSAPGSVGFVRATTNATIVGVNGVGILYSDASNNAYYGFQTAATGLGASSFFQAQNAGGTGNNGGTAFVVSGAGTTSGITGAVAICIGATAPANQINFLGGAFTGNPGNLGTMQWATGMTAILTQASTSGAVGADFTITPQVSTAATNWTNGNVVLAFAAPGGTGVESYLKAKRGGSFIAQLGPQSGQTYGALFLGSSISPASNNYAISSDGTANTWVNAAGASGIVNLAVNGVVQLGLLGGGGTPILQWTSGVTSPSIGQGGKGSDTFPQSLTIFAQSAYALSTGVNVNGATLALWGGDAKSDGVTGRRGGVQAFLGAGNSAMYECAELILGQRIVSLCKGTGAGVTSGDMPVNTGDLVTFLGNALTVPTASPSNGAILYATAGALWVYQSNGTNFQIAPQGNLSLVTKNANYTISATDGEIWCGASGFNLTLPTPTSGRVIWVWDSGGNFTSLSPVTLVRHGSENIDGAAASKTLNAQWGLYRISSDGTNWAVRGM